MKLLSGLKNLWKTAIMLTIDLAKLNLLFENKSCGIASLKRKTKTTIIAIPKRKCHVVKEIGFKIPPNKSPIKINIPMYKIFFRIQKVAFRFWGVSSSLIINSFFLSGFLFNSLIFAGIMAKIASSVPAIKANIISSTKAIIP
jgi:hypothetical protein